MERGAVDKKLWSFLPTAGHDRTFWSFVWSVILLKRFFLYLRSFSATRSAFFANRRGESRLIGWLTKSSGVFYYPRVAQRVFEHPCGDWLTRPPEFCTIHGSAYEFFTMRADFSWRVKVFICRCTWPSQGKRAFTNRRNDSRFIEWRPRNLKFFAARGQCKKFF